MNGTEQNQNGLTDDNDDLFELAFQSTLNRKPVEIKETKEETVESEGNAADENETTAATTATEEGNSDTGNEAGNNDPLADLPENVRNIILQKEKELEAARRAELEWKQKYKSDEGRIAALQRQKQEYERALRERTQPTQTEQKQTETKLKVEETEEWKVLQEADPALAKLFKMHLEETTRQAEERAEARAKAAVEPLYREREVSVQEQKRVRLNQLVPDLPQIVQDPNYAEWFEAQPEGLQRMAEGSAEEIATVIRLFATDRPDLFAPPQHSQQSQTETKQPVTSATNVDKLTQERQRKVQVQGVTGKVTPTPTEMSEDDMFKLAFKNNLVKR